MIDHGFEVWVCMKQDMAMHDAVRTTRSLFGMTSTCVFVCMWR
jgi:hypothetical protein